MDEKTKLDMHNDDMNVMAGLEGMLNQGYTFEKQKHDDSLTMPLIGATTKIVSNTKRSSKAEKHSQAWHSSINEALRVGNFARDDDEEQGTTPPNYTLQKRDRPS